MAGNELGVVEGTTRITSADPVTVFFFHSIILLYVDLPACRQADEYIRS